MEIKKLIIEDQYHILKPLKWGKGCSKTNYQSQDINELKMLIEKDLWNDGVILWKVKTLGL